MLQAVAVTIDVPVATLEQAGYARRVALEQDDVVYALRAMPSPRARRARIASRPRAPFDWIRRAIKGYDGNV